MLEHRRLDEVGEDTLTTRRAAALVGFAVTASLLVAVCYTDIGHSVAWFEHRHVCVTTYDGLHITHKHGSDEISVSSYQFTPVLGSHSAGSNDKCLDHAYPDWRARWGSPEERVLLVPEHAHLPKDSVITDYYFHRFDTDFSDAVHTHVCNTGEPEVLFIKHTHSGDREALIRRGPYDIGEGDANGAGRGVEIECLNHAYPGGWRGTSP